MGAALAGEADPRRGPADDESRPRVGPVEERLEPTHHERVVQGADREERHALNLVGEAELAEQEEEVHLRDPQLDVPSLRRDVPAQGPGVGLVDGRFREGRPHSDLVDPASEARRGADVRRDGDQVLGHAGQRATGRAECGRTPPGSRSSERRGRPGDRNLEPRPARMRQPLEPQPGLVARVGLWRLGVEAGPTRSRASGRPNRAGRRSAPRSAGPSGSAACPRSAARSP